MKKFLTLSLLAAAGLASAASINWKTSTTRNTFVWDSDGNKFNGAAYLVLADDVSKILAPTEDKDFATLLDENKLAKVDLTGGAYAVSQSTVTNDKLTRGQEYDFQLLLVDSNGNYKLSGTAKNAAYLSGTDDPTVISFGASAIGASGSAPADPAAAWTDAPVYGGGGQGGGETIPEPATGALALAGVALLFKRRRA